MENAQYNKETAATITNSNSLFGTSSDDIIEDLHHGNLVDANPLINMEFPDKDQIVNAQDQQEIVNPVQDETDSVSSDTEVTNPTGNEQTEVPDADLNTDTDVSKPGTEIEPPLEKPGSDENATQRNLPKM